MSLLNSRYFNVFSVATCVWGLLCVALMFAPKEGAAQQQGASAGEDPIHVSFRVYLWPQVSEISGYIGEEGYRYVAPQIAYRESLEGPVKRIDAQNRRISEVYSYTGQGPLVFFNDVDGATGDAAQRVPLGSVAADKLVSGDILLIFFPNNSKDGPTYNILPVEAPSRRIPDGQAMFYNLTKETLAIYTGKRPQTLEPRALTLMDLGRKEGGVVPLSIMVKVHENDEWVPRHSEQQTIRDEEKLLFFVFPRDSESNRVRVLSINTAI